MTAGPGVGCLKELMEHTHTHLQKATLYSRAERFKEQRTLTNTIFDSIKESRSYRKILFLFFGSLFSKDSYSMVSHPRQVTEIEQGHTPF